MNTYTNTKIFISPHILVSTIIFVSSTYEIIIDVV